MVQIVNNRITSTEGKWIHRLGTEQYFRRATALPADTPADFEETDAPPAYTEAEYEERVEQLIRQRYTASQELALINNAMLSLAMPAALAVSGDETERHRSEYAQYQLFRQQCKRQAKEELSSPKQGQEEDQP